jgi:hypothetical protein
MPHTRDEITENLAERLCWQVARRDDARVARRLYRKPGVDGVYRLAAGAVLADFFHFLQVFGGMALLEQLRGAAIDRVMVPFVQDVLRYGLKTRVGSERINALPALWVRDEALRRLVGFKAPQVRQGVCQRGRSKRQGERTPGPMCPDTLANPMGQCHLRDLEALFNGVRRALAKAGVVGQRVTGSADGTDLDTTERDQGWGQATRKRRLEDKRGQGHAIEVTVSGGQALLLIEAVTKIPLAVNVVQMQAHEALWTRAWVTQARVNWAGYACLDKVVFARGCLAGTDLWWLEQPGIRVVVPATDTMAVTADARALAAAGEGRTVGHRVHMVRHGPGRTADSERLATEVVGITGLTTYEPSGTEEHGRHHHRRDFEPNPIHVVVVRQWHGRDYGPGGNTVCLSHASVQQPLQPCADDDDRRLIEHGCIKEAKQPWDLKQPPQKTARAVRVQVTCTRLMCALATAYRLQREREALGAEPVGWQRWRRQLQEHNRDKLIVFARGYDGIFPVAEYSLLLGVKRQDVPPGIGTLPEILARYRLTAQG